VRLGQAREQLAVVALGVVIVGQAVEEDVVDEVLRPRRDGDGGVDAAGVPDRREDAGRLGRCRGVEEAEGYADAGCGGVVDCVD